MPASGALSSPGKGLRFLSFDGGGIRVVSQALMIREIMSRVSADRQLSGPARACDYFDMICGSGFGGLLAIMCGILKMTGDELVDEFVNLCKAVFSEGLDTTQRTIVLEGEIKRLIGTYSHGGEERRMICPDDVCKVVDCMLWEAGRATTAMLDLFSPIVIGEAPVGETFVGGDLRWNNPTEELTQEAALIFKDHYITSIINIGSGHPGHMSLSKGLADLFPRIALDCERVADDMERRFSGTPEAFWRLSVEQGLQHLAVDLSNLDALISHTRSYLQGARTTRSIDSLLHDLIHRPERIPVDGISGIAPVVLQVLCRKPCPPPTQYFTGRRADLRQLDEYFNSGRDGCRVAVLYGIGGGGKSQTGLEFIRQSQDRFNDVFFIDASDKFTLENDLKAIASRVADKPTIEDALHLLRTTKAKWLLFLDNADDTSLDLRPYIMWSHGNVLITTRNREARVHAPDCNIWVDKLELDDAKELLLRGVAVEKNSETDMIASEIVQKLGCLALAVSQARGFLAQDICTLSEYLPIYMQNRRKLLEDRLIQTTDGYEHTVYTTWVMSFSRLSSTAAFFLELLCFIHHDSIPSRIFEDAWKVYVSEVEGAVPPRLVEFLSTFSAADSTWNVLNFRLLIKEILSFSLIEFNPVNHTFSLHPLVQQWAQSQCHHPQEMTCSTQTLLSLASPEPNSKENYAIAMSLLPHLRSSAQTGLKLHFTLLHGAGLIYRLGGMFRECSEVHEQEVLETQKKFGLTHPNTLGSMSNLAAAYSALGQHREGLKLHDKVLALRIQTLGEKHPSILISMNNVASAYSALGQHKDALILQKAVLALSPQILGEKDPNTLISMNNLAYTHSALGEHSDARKLGEKALALSTQIWGEDHPDTLANMGNLASTYSALGENGNALKFREKVLRLSTRILGEKHPATLISMGDLALTYSSVGRHNDALKLQEQNLALSIQILGEQHPDTLACMNNLAGTYSALRKYNDALKLQEKVLALWTQTLGKEHPDTLTSMNNLAGSHSALGQHKDALNLEETVLARRTKILGERHPDTLTTMSMLAYTYSYLGRHMDALKPEKKALTLMTQILGEEHPDTLTSMGNLACTYAVLGQLQDALKLHEQTLNMRRRVLGPEHPSTICSLKWVERLHNRMTGREGRK
ncbi:hypothetical protein DL96DRAFT_1676352 [Flagelloscypha sp. PMI_526]|nr:hypothetical protein DL96DRAFT_1676352 [Flagelloscypha sp. PMI_526]